MPAFVKKEDCVGCGACVGECPQEAIKMDGDVAVVDPALCVDCELCVGACPNNAIVMK